METTISSGERSAISVFRLAGENLRLAANCPFASGRAHLASCQRTNPAVLQLESQWARFDLGLLVWALDLNRHRGTTLFEIYYEKSPSLPDSGGWASRSDLTAEFFSVWARANVWIF